MFVVCVVLGGGVDRDRLVRISIGSIQALTAKGGVVSRQAWTRAYAKAFEQF
jgi:hypothetical protein